MDLNERISIYENEMETLQFDSFTNTDAWKIGNIMAKKIIENNFPLAVDIDIDGVTLYRYAHTGATDNLQLWLAKKRRTVLFAGESSILFGCKLERDGKTLAEVVAPNDPTDYVRSGGSFPIIVKGKGVIGAFSSSGLLPTEDHQILVDSIREYLNKSLEETD